MLTYSDWLTRKERERRARARRQVAIMAFACLSACGLMVVAMWLAMGR